MAHPTIVLNHQSDTAALQNIPAQKLGGDLTSTDWVPSQKEEKGKEKSKNKIVYSLQPPISSLIHYLLHSLINSFIDSFIRPIPPP
mmetsp:Transcript_12822/g.25055  ORF Transcript_12822/g.25055 Transcript_12822/m.25055 type:complete len:86 (-) Transcript_12822:316-573(-)